MKSTAVDTVQHLELCALALYEAYAKADPKNGGGSSVDWDDVNYAWIHARNGLSKRQRKAIDEAAKKQNT